MNATDWQTLISGASLAIAVWALLHSIFLSKRQRKTDESVRRLSDLQAQEIRERSIKKQRADIQITLEKARDHFF